MATNKEGNGYTFGFAIALVVVVGTLLASIAMWTKPFKDKNDMVKKQISILKALLPKNESDKITRKNAEDQFINYVDLNEALVLNASGGVIEGVYDKDGSIINGDPFDIDIKQEYKDKKRDEANRNYPLFVAEYNGEKAYIIPVIGKGLWGPIWGNICLASDMKTIQGASFDHKSETPGLGAEIKQGFFTDRWVAEEITNDSGEFMPFEIVKDNSGSEKMSKVDGITGGTITSKGVEEMVNRCLKPYVAYFKNLQNN